MGRRASRWPAILTGPEQILEAHWLSLFRAAPRPVQQVLLADGNDRRIHGDVLEVKDANYSRRFGSEVLGRVGMPARAAGYGDVLACVAALWGLSVQDPSAEELDGKTSLLSARGLCACRQAGVRPERFPTGRAPGLGRGCRR